MEFDVCIAGDGVYLGECLSALGEAAKGHSVSVYIAGDASAVDLLLEEERFSLLQYVPAKGNCLHRNFCAAAQVGRAQWLLLLDAGMIVEPDFFDVLQQALVEMKEAAAFEARQLPLEQEHHINPVTLECADVSLNCLLVRRSAFVAAGGPDIRLVGPAVGTDFVLRLKAMGGQVVFLSEAVAVWAQDAQPVPEHGLVSYADLHEGKLLLAYKYDSCRGMWRAGKAYRKEMKQPRHFEGVRRELLKRYLKHFAKMWPIWLWRFAHAVQYRAAKPYLPVTSWPGRGQAYLAEPVKTGSFISVVVRTSGRPEVLYGALASLKHQTYRDFEVVVVEDGPATAQHMVETEFAMLPVRYFATQERVGRGRTGNLGLERAQGEYLNFLDDDDYFYPDHLERMAAVVQKNPRADMVLGTAMAMEVQPNGEASVPYDVKALYPMRFDRIDVFTMSQMCRIPIQTVMFKRSLFERCGGLREDIDGNEDWAMWMRFLMVAKRANPEAADVPRATSVFVQPADKEAARLRLQAYKVYNEQLFSDDTLKYEVTMAEMRRFFDDMIKGMRHLQGRGELETWLEEQAHRND